MLFGEMDFDEHRLIIDGIDLMQRHVKFTSSQPHKTSNPEYLKPINILSQKTSNNKLLPENHKTQNPTSRNPKITSHFKSSHRSLHTAWSQMKIVSYN